MIVYDSCVKDLAWDQLHLALADRYILGMAPQRVVTLARVGVSPQSTQGFKCIHAWQRKHPWVG